MYSQNTFSLPTHSRGCHLITQYILDKLPSLPRIGMLHVFIQHTSAALSINENADPDVQIDLAAIMDRLVKERESYYRHIYEGDDDMPAHAKASLIGSSLTIPITNGRLNLGTWQGIYLCEFRNHANRRRLVVTVMGE